MLINGRLELDSLEEILGKRNLEEGGLAQRFVDSEALRLCTPYVPRDNEILIGSGIECTDIGSGQVIYDTPYARRWYYEPARFQGAPKRGNYWFERMKNEGGKEQILQGLAALTGGRAR